MKAIGLIATHSSPASPAADPLRRSPRHTHQRKTSFRERAGPCHVSSEKHLVSWMGLPDPLVSQLPALSFHSSRPGSQNPSSFYLLFAVQPPHSQSSSAFIPRQFYSPIPRILEPSVINSSLFLGSSFISRSPHIPSPFLPFFSSGSHF